MKKQLSLIIVGVILLFNVGAVVAHHGEGENNHSVRREVTQMRSEEVREKSEERKALIKQQVTQRKETIKQENCERRKAKLTSAMPKMANGANTVKSVIDKHYERVQGFYADGQLTVDNYDELVAAIELAKTEAEAALQTVNDYKFEIDCSANNTGEQLDAYRTAIKDAKTALKAYRKALVDLISSLRAEAASNRNNSEGENTNESE